jgi:signal transduction histidine kinase
MSKAALPAQGWLELQAAAALGRSRPFGWALLAGDLQLEAASAGFWKLTGLEEDGARDQPISRLLWEFVGAEAILLQVLIGEVPVYRLDNVYRDWPGGEGRYLTFQVTAVAQDGQEERLLMLVEDSSDLGQMQQRLVQDRNELRLARRQLEVVNASLRQLNRQKSLYLAMAAHDLRTPLTSIQGFTDLVRHELPNELEEQRQLLDFVYAQGDKLQRLIADVLDLEIIERGELAIRRRECVLNDMLYEILAALRPTITLQELVLETRIPDDPLVLQADPVRLEQIIYNLLGNAMKYSPAGGKIAVTAGRSAGAVWFQVANEGTPLSQAQIRRLFDAYYRTEQARGSGSPGSGLGLYIVKMLVEAHGGEVRVESQEGAGNRFSVYLPDGKEPQGAEGGR